jgi:hypothetical protein
MTRVSADLKALAGELKGFHPIADIWPMATPEESNEIAEDIRKNGQREDIVMLDGLILDGRQRYRGCLKAGVEPRFVEFGRDPSHGTDPLAYVISKHTRRNLTTTQKAKVADRLTTFTWGGDRSKPPTGGLNETYTQAQAAAATNVGERSVERYADIRKHGTEELKHAVDREDISLRAGSEISKLPAQQQNAQVEQNRAAKTKPKRRSREEIANEAAEKAKPQVQARAEIIDILIQDLKPDRLKIVLFGMQALAGPTSDFDAILTDIEELRPDWFNDDRELLAEAGDPPHATDPTTRH